MNQSGNQGVLFRETQQFRQRLLWFLLVGASVLVVLFFGYGMIKQIVFGQMWGNRPMSNMALIIVGLSTILFIIGLMYLFYSLKLITEVRNDGLFIRFFPLSHKIITFDNIKSCEVRSYKPIKEYGGWGIRYGLKGKAYNVSGNRGVQLELSKGRPLLIGSQKPEELASAINKKRNTLMID